MDGYCLARTSWRASIFDIPIVAFSCYDPDPRQQRAMRSVWRFLQTR